jgi:hypothetical protein
VSTLPREVHEVLEDEYVSMYGPLDRIPFEYTTREAKDADDRTVEQIIDVASASSILREWGVGREGMSRVEIAAKLNGFIAELPKEKLASWRGLSNSGRLLLERHDELSGIAAKQGRLEELNRRIIDDAFDDAVQPLSSLRTARVYAALHERAKNPAKEARTALCISGGGIRSATFALGVMQGLASAKILDKFDYLSTVSGGGYIGSWLSSWSRRHPHGISGVQEDLARADTAAGGTRPARAGNEVPPELPRPRARKIEPEPVPLTHLREYSNYLSPRMGILSGDSWTMGALYMRNLLLNLMVLVPIFAAVLFVPRTYAYLSTTTLALHEWIYPAGTVLFIAMAFAYIGRKRPVEDSAGESQSTSDGYFIRGCVLPLLGASIMLTLFWTDVALDPDELNDKRLLLLLGIAILSMTVLPFVLYYRRLRVAYTHARSMAYADAAILRKHLTKKAALEAFGAVLGLATACGLIWLLAVKVFDQPLLGFKEMLNEAQSVPPALRVVSTTPWASIYTVFAVPAVMLVFFIQASIFVGISSKRNEDYDREWWGRAGAWILVFAAGWAVLSGIAVFGPLAIYNAPVLLGSIGGLSGLAAGVLGFSGRTPANKKEKEDAGATAKAGNAALSLATPLFVLFFLALISLGTTWLTQELKYDIDYKQATLDSRFEATTKRVSAESDLALETTAASAAAPAVSLTELRSLNHLDTVYKTTWWEVMVVAIVAAFAWFLSRRIGVNKFSMHALYRNRLIRAYLGASRYRRQPNPFTGFDERDNLHMFQLRPELLWPTNLKDPAKFFKALQEGARTTQTDLSGDPLERRKLAQHIWSRFFDRTCDQVMKGVNNVSIDGVIQNLNDLLLDEKLLEKEADLKLPPNFWTITGEGKIPYPAATRNRAVLDYYFSHVITPMTRPKDAPSDEKRVAVQGGTSKFLETGDGARRRAPLHVINMALNLVSGEKLAWQQRMAETFTTSPYHTGNAFLGYRDSRHYGGREGITVGGAVTISGAAASPNMGYHSSPALAFLLTLFNVRLGSWLGNPGPAGQDTYQAEHPDSNLKPILFEAIGRTNDTYPWVYLSDGGHFENLGLYEMVLRRCHYIVLSDAGADPKCTFEDLGNAIRKIRTDLGVPIDIEETFMLPRTDNSMDKEGRYVATATIRYKAMDGQDAVDGTLIYLKPGVYKDEYFPRDVYNYALDSTDFPHEPTSDQFFSESQFESYRALGRHAINQICGNYPADESEWQIPIAKQYDDVAHFAKFVRERYDDMNLADVPPAKLIASAIRQLKP